MDTKLVDYVQQQFAMGNSREDIQKSLSTSGWTQSDIDEAFTAIASQPVKERSATGRIFHGVLRAIEIVIVLVILAGGVIVWYVFHKVNTDVETGQASSSEKGLLTFINATIIQKGLEGYKASNKTYPASLSELTPQYLQSVPTDPTTNASFQYQVGPDGSSYQLCTLINNQNTCATATSTIDGRSRAFRDSSAPAQIVKPPTVYPPSIVPAVSNTRAIVPTTQ